jgi:uncharacterized membrane protein YkvA (DUF1232 family)
MNGPLAWARAARRGFGDLVGFIRNVANDPRIPDRDRAVLLVMVGLLVSPVDLIPDWIPVFGQVDDVMILALILDYFFEVLDAEILLAHYPWDMKGFARMRRGARWVARLAPGFLKRRLWAYVGSPYKQA